MPLGLHKKKRNALATAMSSSPSYDLTDGPPVLHPLRKNPDHVAQRPDVMLNHGRTLVQPRLPALLGQFGMTEPRRDNRPPPPISDQDRAAEEFAAAASDGPDIVHIANTPPPDRGKHQRK